MVRANEGIRRKEIGKRIALARREANGMTQRELATYLGVTERQVASYEAGAYIPYRHMAELEEAVGRTASWILYGDEINNGSNKEIIERLERLEQKLEEVLAKL